MENLQECGICSEWHVGGDGQATYPLSIVNRIETKHRNAIGLVKGVERRYSQAELDKILADIEASAK